MEAETTTIKFGRETKLRLDHLKEYERESYDEILQKMLDILNTCRVSPARARGKLILIDRQRRRRSKEPPAQKKILEPVR